ncbi:SPASM domain-containing protein [Jiella pacifica]|uniref:SPASM domain-containing protein n=1 Tax=Jiella pacifica TaxID=2696469 RepID=UPI0013D27EE8|nr:radical SAM/SPASM domain-containing protein [Jiella pacifica]
MSISLDAATDHTYQKIRIGAPEIGKVFSSIEQLLAAREVHGRTEDFRVEIGFTLMLSNIHELPLLLRKASAVGVDAVNCRHLELYHEEMIAESLLGHEAYFNAIRQSAIDFAAAAGLRLNIGSELRKEEQEGGMEPCYIPFGSAVVLANGDVMACCVPGSKVGNLSENSLEDIWNGDLYKKLRSSVNSPKPPSLCKSCHFSGSMNRFGSVAEAARSRGARPLLEELTGAT